MKNLLPLKRKISYWDSIVNKRNHVAREPLQIIRHLVLARFKTYYRLTTINNLKSISDTPFAEPNTTLLAGCYSDSDGLSALKAKIKDKQPELLKGECQYCNIGEPNTFDHYLPQNLFPEFVALSINLIPCCSTCNLAKGKFWLIGTDRKVINFYYDVLPDVQYLKCTIIYRAGVPQAAFSINGNSIANGMRAVITNHFDCLNLFDRYKLRSNSEIMDVLNAISPSVGRLTRAEIQNQLIGEATKMQASKGKNYWRAICRLALARSNDFLIDAGF